MANMRRLTITDVAPVRVLILGTHARQVSQRSEDGGPVISVNFWHDMAFDSRTAMTGLVHGLAEQLGLNDPA